MVFMIKLISFTIFENKKISTHATMQQFKNITQNIPKTITIFAFIYELAATL